MTRYVEPEYSKKAFACPFCGAFSSMLWNNLLRDLTNTYSQIHEATCVSCEKKSIWLQTYLPQDKDGRMLYPQASSAPMPSEDLPDDCKVDYMEARDIASQSPRAAAGLLRLVIQKLCKHLGEPGKDINTDIGSLVKKGLPVQIQTALDTVRVIGNEAVHPGSIDLNANPEIVGKLFKLVNLIVTRMITDKEELDGLFDSLPAGKLDGIKSRDAKK